MKETNMEKQLLEKQDEVFKLVNDISKKLKLVLEMLNEIKKSSEFKELKCKSKEQMEKKHIYDYA